MPGSESVVLSPLQTALRLGVAVLIVAGCVAALAALVRLLARRWRARSQALSQELDEGLTALQATLSHLQSEVLVYPSDVPPPYGPIVRQLQGAVESVETDHRALVDGAERLDAGIPSVPDAGMAKLAYWFWQDPRHWWHRLKALGSLVAQLDPPRAEASVAETLLRDLRRQPLDTAERARELLELVDGSQHTVSLLKTEGVHGAALDAAQATLTAYRATFNSLPVYLFACTDSQIVRRALPGEIASAWATVQELEAGVRESAAQVTGWHAAHTLSGQELRAMHRRMEVAKESINAAPEALDISELTTEWNGARAEAESLVACFATPATDDLDCVAEIAKVTNEVNQVIEQVNALGARHRELEAQISGAADALGQIDQQLRQLAEAGRYPLDRVPIQAELDLLAQQYRYLDGEAPDAPVRTRTPTQLSEDLAATNELVEAAHELASQVAAAREQRRRLIELLDERTRGQQVDWLGWANDLHQRTHPYDRANWSTALASNRGAGSKLSERIKEALTPQQPVEDLRVHLILDDAAGLTERQERWMPAHVDDPLPHDRLEEQTAALTELFADIEDFQDRLDKITLRFQQCQETEEQAKSDLSTVYGAVDRLDMAAADVLPPALANEDNHWSRSREKLDEGYELELALSNPAVGTVDEKAQQVEAWIGQTQSILSNWQKALAREMTGALATLSADLDDLAAVAPLDSEPAVRQAQAVSESMPGQVQVPRAPLGKRRTPVQDTATQGISAMSTRLSGDIIDQLRNLASVDETLSALRANVLTPLTEPIQAWREAEQAAESRFSDLQRLQTQSAQLWPPVSCDTAAVKAEFGQADRIRDQLYQNGKSVTQVLDTLTTLTGKYAGIIGMIEVREKAYQDQRPVLEQTLDYMETWCATLERYRSEHADNQVASAAVRARLDEIEASWTQLQIRYDQAPGLIPGDEAIRSVNDLWHQARRQLPLGPGLDVLTADDIEER